MRKIILMVLSLMLVSTVLGGCGSESVDKTTEKLAEMEVDAQPLEKEYEPQTTVESDEQSRFDEVKQSMLEDLNTVESFVKANQIDTKTYVPFASNNEVSMTKLENNSLCFSWDYLGIPCMAKWENNKLLSYFGEPLTKDNVMFDTQMLARNMEITNHSFSEETGAFVFAGLEKNLRTQNDQVENLEKNKIFYARWNGKMWVNVSGLPFSIENVLVVESVHCCNACVIDILKSKKDKHGNPSIAWTNHKSMYRDDNHNESQLKCFFFRWTKESWINLDGKVIDGNSMRSAEQKFVVPIETDGEIIEMSINSRVS